MTDYVYEIIDEIENSNDKKRLDDIKKKIESSSEAKRLIKEFYLAKEDYEKYNLKDDFLKAKEKLFSNDLIREYINIQNEVNLLMLNINKRIKDITRSVTKK